MARRNRTGINKSHSENEALNTTTPARRAMALAGLIIPCLLDLQRCPVCGGEVERQPQGTQRQQVAELGAETG